MSELGLHAFQRPRLWLLLWVAMLKLALIVSLVPLPRVEMPVAHFDKLEHALGYAVLSAWASMLFAAHALRLSAWLGLVAYGALIEVLQAALPWRSGDLSDLAANVVGVALGAAVVRTPLEATLRWIDARLPAPRA